MVAFSAGVAAAGTLVVIRRDGLVFGAEVIGAGDDSTVVTHIQPVFQFTGARIGFAPEDRFTRKVLAIIGSLSFAGIVLCSWPLL
jgi:hypothetical protein